MRVNILRGENQIGGSIVEISTADTRIIFDVGGELNDEENQPLPLIDGLFNSAGYDALFISHNHADHMGLVNDVYKEIPVYMGEKSVKVVNASNRYMNRALLSVSGYLEHKKPIRIGGITVTPFLCDHSAFDSYMLLAEAEGVTALYTGDFRANGRKSYRALLKVLPQGIDVLICEGTNLSRANAKAITEKDIEESAVSQFRKHKGPIFVLQSAMNIDRIVTMYRSAKRSGRTFLEDLYMAEITCAIEGSIPNPMSFNDVRTFITRPYDRDHFRYKLLCRYEKNKIGKSGIAKEKFVMCVRNSMLNYMKSLNKQINFEDGLLIYSLWNGYKVQPEMQVFLQSCEEMGLEISSLHTSGHADETAIKELIDVVKPKKIMPIHTENAAWFNEIEAYNS